MLEELDVSWCRGITGAALGMLADTCPNLRLLRLFGCTQARPALQLLCLLCGCKRHSSGQQQPGWHCVLYDSNVVHSYCLKRMPLSWSACPSHCRGRTSIKRLTKHS